MEGWNTTWLGMPNITHVDVHKSLRSSEFTKETDHSKRKKIGH
jgi:hypothetical protein